jgi:PHD/YefM family antitoxin component YafN of YafNO toxin-antitoxin module
MDITRDILPLTEFKRQSAEFVGSLKQAGRPLVLTIDGKPELVLLNAGAYEAVRDRLEGLGTSSDTVGQASKDGCAS